MSEIKPDKKIPGETDPIPKKKTQEEANNLAQSLLNGTVEPANEFVEYLLERMKGLAGEGMEVETIVKQLKDRLGHAERRLQATKVEINAYQKDLVEWQERGQK